MKLAFLIAVSLILLSSPAANATTLGLVAHYEFEGDFSDSVGSADGTSSGGTSFTGGVHGQAASFDGVNDFVTVLNAEGIFGSDPDSWSVSFWGKDDSPTSNKSVFVTDYNGGSGHDPVFGFMFATELDATLSLEVRVSPNNSVILSPETVGAGDWHHYAMTASETTGEVKLFIDGILIDTESLVVGDHFDSNPIYFGATQINSGITPSLQGQLDDVRFYNRALNDGEVANLALPVSAPAGLILLFCGLLSLGCVNNMTQSRNGVPA